ncbi:MAG: hypothetical protein ACI4I0_02960 [Acutalibacteraceae bacterium]
MENTEVLETKVNALEKRVKQCESDVKSLFDRSNKAEVREKEIATKLDNVLVELGRVRESIDTLKSRPIKFWDRFIFAFIGAAAAAMASLIINGGL